MGARVIELLLNNPGGFVFSPTSFSHFMLSGVLATLKQLFLCYPISNIFSNGNSFVIQLYACYSQVVIIPGQSFFFAFGAGHFVGEHTILDVVRKAGFRVDQVAMRMEMKMVLLLLKMIMNMKMYKSHQQNGRWRSLMI